MKRLYYIVNCLSVVFYIATIIILGYLTNLIILYGNEIFSIFVVLFPATMVILLVTVVISIIEIYDFYKKGNPIRLIPKVNATFSIAMVFSIVNGAILIREKTLFYLSVFTILGLVFLCFYLIHRKIVDDK